MAPQSSDAVVVCQPFCHSFPPTSLPVDATYNLSTQAPPSPPCSLPNPVSIYSALDVDCTSSVSCPKVISAIASILERTMSVNGGGHSEVPHQLSVFHGMSAPAISVAKYLERILKYSNCSPSCFVLAHVYLDRLLRRQRSLQLTTLTVHRLVITSLMVAAKFFEDDFFNNGYYARVGGLPTSEMNRLELEFLLAIDFRLSVSSEEFDAHCEVLLSELLYIGALAPAATLAVAGATKVEQSVQFGGNLMGLPLLLQGQEQTVAEEEERQADSVAIKMTGLEKRVFLEVSKDVDCVITVQMERLGQVNARDKCMSSPDDRDVAFEPIPQCGSREVMNVKSCCEGSGEGKVSIFGDLWNGRSLSTNALSKPRAADAFSWTVPGSADELHDMHSSPSDVYGWPYSSESGEDQCVQDYTEDDDYCGEVMPDMY